MPHKLPPYVECFRDRHGKLRTYFRKKGCRLIPLPAVVNSGEFREAYAKALLAVPRKEPAAARAAATGTISALCQSYYESDEFAAVRDTTKSNYREAIEIIRAKYGHHRIDGLRHEENVKKILAPFRGKPGRFRTILAALRLLIRHAKLPHDALAEIKKPRLQTIHTWTEEEIAQFEARWPIGTKQRTAFGLLLFTAQRRGDVWKMRWTDIRADSISLVQQKTKTGLVIPLHVRLREILLGAKRDHVVIVTTEYGRPYSLKGFTSLMAAAIAAAGLGKHCRPHGLRRATCRRLAEAGCSVKQIAAISGHKSLLMVQHYCDDVEQEQLARAAIVKLERPENRADHSSAKPVAKPKNSGRESNG